MANIDLPGLLAFYRITKENWDEMLEETKAILRSRWTENKKYYKGTNPAGMAGGEKPDADPVLQTDMRRVNLTDGYALFGTDAQGLRYVGLYADDDRDTIFIAEGDSTRGLPSYWELVAKLQEPQPFTKGLASSEASWTVEDVSKHAEHLRGVNSALDDVFDNARGEISTAERIENAIDDALAAREHRGDYDDVYKPLSRRIKHQHDAVIEG